MKKVIAIIAAAAVAGALLPCGISAEEPVSSASSSASQSKEDDGMTEALAMVKSRITIPEEYSEFSCTAGEYRGVKSFNFQWSKPGSSSRYFVRVRGDIIAEYETPDRFSSQHKSGFSEYTRKDFIIKAQNWIYRANPSMRGYISADESDVDLYLNDNNVYIGFKRDYGQIPVKGTENNIRIGLNKYTGEVNFFNANWWQGAKFTSAEKVMPESEIRKIYSAEVTVKPWYRISTENGKTTVNIVYEPQNSFIYDAFTGEHSKMNEDYLAAMDTDNYITANPMSGDAGEGAEAYADTEEAVEDEVVMEAGFTEQEKKAVADMSKMLTSEKFKALMLKDKYMGITEKHLVNNFSINENENAECGFAISCNFSINNKTDYSDIYVEADAESGKVISFYNYSLESNKELNVKKASALAEEVAKYYYGDVFGEFMADPENTSPAVKTEKYKESSRTFRFCRYVNNIQVDGNNMNITVNADGKVTRASCYYTKDADFGDGKVINKDTALSMLFEQKPMNLYYDGFTDLRSAPHTYLIYSMDSWSLNAKTGKLCNYNGFALEEKTESYECPYTDIEKSPYKDEIALLYSYGVKLDSSDKFRPGAKITESELVRLIKMVDYGNYPMPLEDVVEEAIAETEDGKTPAPAPFTRRQLAALMVKQARAERFADKNEIFRSPFKDVTQKDKDLGYIAIAWAMGIIDADAKGNFTPDAEVTREYAFHCIYNMIVNAE